MTLNPRLVTLKQCMESELRANILPFWINHTIDRENGGFYGALTNDLQIRNEVERSLVLCARLLWTYSAAYRLYGDPTYRQMAEHAYQYLTGPFIDHEAGGMYWWIDCHGRPVNDRKQTYGQAFAIYGLTEYYRAVGHEDSLKLAQALFHLIEKHAYEPAYGGYIEGCTRDWSQLADMRLSQKEPYNCPKSMNTLLHVIEGYTNLLRVVKDSEDATHPLRERPQARQVAPSFEKALKKLLTVFMDHVVDPQSHFTRLFFDNDWRSLSDHISFGHDIETSWLLVKAAEVLGDEGLIERARRTAVEMAGAVYNQGLDADGSVLHEGTPHGIIQPEKHWWCQAEGIVGLVNAYQISGAEKYVQAAARIWDFIDAHMIDREHGEWFKVLTREGQPLPGQVKVGPWEDPYHHARACMEMIYRAK